MASKAYEEVILKNQVVSDLNFDPELLESTDIKIVRKQISYAMNSDGKVIVYMKDGIIFAYYVFLRKTIDVKKRPFAKEDDKDYGVTIEKEAYVYQCSSFAPSKIVYKDEVMDDVIILIKSLAQKAKITVIEFDETVYIKKEGKMNGKRIPIEPICIALGIFIGWGLKSYLSGLVMAFILIYIFTVGWSEYKK